MTKPKRPRIPGKSIATLKAKLDKEFSRWIRLRHTDEYGRGMCITCKKTIHWKQGDAGHFISRALLNTRFEPRNVHLQCKGCNGYGNGMQYLHGKAIDEMHGSGTAEVIYMMSKRPRKIDPCEYMELIELYTRLANELEQRKMG